MFPSFSTASEGDRTAASRVVVLSVGEGARSRRTLAGFMRDEAMGGAVLAAATLTALLWANVAPGSYHDVWAWTIGPDSPLHVRLSLHGWVNDALMTVFFFAVGLEIKRELVEGELAKPRDAAMPVIGALGGMFVPAALYLALNSSGPGSDGWAIPVATDIAFVLGVLSLVGRRAPAGLRLFLLALAIVDDVGGIVIIAVFYSSGISLTWLVAAAVLVLGAGALRRLRIARPAAYLPVGVALWIALHESGVHATLAGVILGLLTPTGVVAGRRVLDDLEHRLHPWSAFAIVPLFALANAGVVLRGDALRDAMTGRVTWGVIAGLVAGKLVGITAVTLIAVRAGVGTLPTGVGVHHLVAGAALAGVGFTVSLFIAGLSFEGSDQLDAAKTGILIASILAVLISTAVFLTTAPLPSPPDDGTAGQNERP